MESPECFRGKFYSDGNTHFAREKKAGGGAGDHFAVEDLLDFSNKEESGVLLISGDDGNAGNSTDSSTVTAVDSRSNSSGPEPHFPTHHVCRSFNDAGLCESQYDELAELEWLSNFVEESFSTEDLHNFNHTSGVSSTSSKTAATTQAEISSQDVAGGARQLSPRRPSAHVPGKARSKRSRVTPCNWSSRLPVLSPSQMVASSPESELIVLAGFAAGFSVEKAAPKPAPRKKNPSTGAALAAAEGRKCLHCQTDKTPQWRTGPMGPKTLCNACGVRFKSGRLVPEYRPAASPTFMVSKHSNSHRKVLELRRQKELQQQLHAGGAATSLFDRLSMFSSGGDDLLINGSNFQHLN